jgi:hypothetical protein
MEIKFKNLKVERDFRFMKDHNIYGFEFIPEVAETDDGFNDDNDPMFIAIRDITAPNSPVPAASEQNFSESKRAWHP